MLRILISSCLLLVTVTAACAEKRVALVVGNSRYQHVSPLENPINDAALVAETLKSLGFSIVGDAAQLDLDKARLDQAVQKFGADVQGADVAMFYYAGHGVQVRGSNFLVPINANPTREADVDFQMTDLNLVLNQMQGAGTRLNLVILDACRNNPFGGRSLRSSEGGLAQVRAPEGTLISYATQPGNVAQDGSDGHSPYTRALADTMKRSGLDIFQTFNQVGLSVKRSTGGVQQPWVSSSPIDGSFYFTGGPTASIQTEPTVQAARRPEPQQEARLSPPAKSIADSITDCDRFAANPTDQNRARGVPGVTQGLIDIVPALSACNAAMVQYPDVTRFVYQSGRIALVQKDYARTRQLYEKAASAAYPIAYSAVGSIFYRGYGIPKEPEQARRWFEKGAAVGDASAMIWMGAVYEDGAGAPKDGAMARQWFEKAEVAGSHIAAGNLARLYFYGSNGLPKDVVKARRYAEKGAADNDPAAMNLLGVCYQKGEGVAADLAQARQWYERSANGGDFVGMSNLGFLYLNGTGVSKSYIKAKALFERVAAAGRPTAMSALGRIYLNGLGVSKDKAKARSWFEKALAAGDATAAKQLASLGGTKR